MRVLIIGASRGIGLETARQALEAGYGLRAFARSSAANLNSNSSLENILGDALNVEDVRTALVGGRRYSDSWRGIKRVVSASASVFGGDRNFDWRNENPKGQTFDLLNRIWSWR